MTIAKSANLALSFILELCLLAALGYWGFKTGSATVVQLILCLGTPLLAAVVVGHSHGPGLPSLQHEGFFSHMLYVKKKEAPASAEA